LLAGKNTGKFSIARNLKRPDWKQLLSNSSVVIQCSLSTNFHPPVLTAVDLGCLPIVNYEAIACLEKQFAHMSILNIKSLSYKNIDDIYFILDFLQTPQGTVTARSAVDEWSDLSKACIDELYGVVSTISQTSMCNTTFSPGYRSDLHRICLLLEGLQSTYIRYFSASPFLRNEAKHKFLSEYELAIQLYATLMSTHPGLGYLLESALSYYDSII